jgi:hypothetical protein
MNNIGASDHRHQANEHPRRKIRTEPAMTVVHLITLISSCVGTPNVNSVWPIAVSRENPEVDIRDFGEVIT